MKFCLIGDKLGHSFSASIHTGLGGEYDLISLKQEELKDFFDSFSFDGCNVTIPYKKSVVSYLYALSEAARQTGAVNTVVKKDGKLYGYNTDVDGFTYLVQNSGYSVRDKNVLVLGSGGAANAVSYALKKMGAKKVRMVSRTGECNYQTCYRQTDTQAIVNATPVGMFPLPDEIPVDIESFPCLEAVFDCVYNPLTTKLIGKAKEKGLVAVGGLSMLVEQALCSRDLWLGQTHTKAQTQEIVKRLIFEKSNLVISGMAGAGKTTLGKEVAILLNRSFYDIDEEIFSKRKKTSAQIIEEESEEAFRQAESEIIQTLSNKSGVVIALGGGSVLKKENENRLKQNGVIVYLKRRTELLEEANRPLSQKEGVKALFERRKEIYETTSDCTVENVGEIEKVAKEIIKSYENACYKRS